MIAGGLRIYLKINLLGLPYYLSSLELKGLRELTGLGHLRPFKLYSDSNYIAFVIITLNYYV
jgi:hypothetical protein